MNISKSGKRNYKSISFCNKGQVIVSVPSNYIPGTSDFHRITIFLLQMETYVERCFADLSSSLPNSLIL